MADEDNVSEVPAPIDEIIARETYHDLCPDGDVCLITGSSQFPYKIRTSSQILRLASKVFAALFSSRYAEGHGLDSANPKEILLPEDDQDAMLLLMKILHHQLDPKYAEDVDLYVLSERLVGFVTVVDKYDCGRAVHYTVATLMSKFLNDYNIWTSVEEWKNCMIVAYFLDQPENFKRFSAKVVMHMYTWPGSVTPALVGDLAKYFPTEALVSLALQSQAAYSEFTTTMTKLIDKTRHPNSSISTSDFLEKLEQADLWPFNFRHTNIATIRGRLADIELPPGTKNDFCNCPRGAHDSDYDSLNGGSPRRLRHGPSRPQQTTKFDIKVLEEKMVGACPGLCLDCVRRFDAVGEADGKRCRVKHPDCPSQTSTDPVWPRAYDSDEDVLRW